MKILPLKLSVLTIGISLIAISCSSHKYVESTPPPPPPQQDYYSDQEAPAPISYQSFYDELSPYGQWISTPEYGYVWVPAAGPDFQPYASCGHWVLTNYGWTWASDYSWGWAAFHYGTWDFDGTMGWYWIPGYQWSPAWVTWRSEPGYYGWAPLGPTYTYNGYGTYYCPPERYVFVNARYINDPNMGRYYEPRGQNATYFSRSAIVTNTYYDKGSNNTYYAGPRSTEVERYTGSPVRQVALVQTSSPEKAGANGNQITMFRPPVQQPINNNNAVRPAPQKVYQKTTVTPVQQRQILTHPNQQRATPFKPENTQHQHGGQQEENKQQPNQQHAPTQQPQQQQHAPAQKPNQQHAPMQQPQQQQHAPAQKPNQQQHAPMQQQHAPVQQQGHPQQKPIKQKPAKQQNQQPKQQPQQGQQGKQ